jgi:DNA-binding transcriptional regulator YdaS (Cro superfamily)
MWLALCSVYEYCGSSQKFMSELTGVSQANIVKYIKKGRLSAEGAHIIGAHPEIPFCREELRPDISEEGWKEFDKHYLTAKDRHLLAKLRPVRRRSSV